MISGVVLLLSFVDSEMFLKQGSKQEGFIKRDKFATSGSYNFRPVQDNPSEDAMRRNQRCYSSASAAVELIS